MIRLEVEVETVLLTDLLDQAIHEGDLVLNDSGRIYFVDHTENSFIRQGFLCVREARISRGFWVASDDHQYAMGSYLLRVSPEEAPTEQKERRAYFSLAADIRRANARPSFDL
jgi:hypothetical protein